MTSISSVPNAVIGIAVKVEDAIQWRGSKEVTEVRQYEEEIERNWEKRSKTVVDLMVEGQDGSKIVRYPCFLVRAHETYFSPSESDPEVYQNTWR